MTGRLHSRFTWLIPLTAAAGVLVTLVLRTWVTAQEFPLQLPTWNATQGTAIPGTALQGSDPGTTNRAAAIDQHSIRVSSDIAHQSRFDDGTLVSVMRGNCRIEQDATVLTSKQMVTWESRIGNSTRLDIYLEDDAHVESPASTRQLPQSFLQLRSETGVTYQARWPREYPQITDPLLQRANARRRALAETVSHQAPLVELPADGNDIRAVRIEPPAAQIRRVRVSARTGQPFSARTERSTTSTPAEQIAILTGGIKLNVDSPTPDGRPDPKAIELAADSMVLWTEPTDLENLAQGAERFQTRDTPLQIYLEGNIVIRQKDTILRAARAFYDAREERALLIDAEMKLFMPTAQNFLRIRAHRIRQLTEGAFHAQHAWMSASYFGKPGYRLDSSDIFLEPRVINPWVHANGGWVDPVTGEVDDGVINWITTLDNKFYVEDVPLGYLPYISSPAEDPHLPIKKATFKTDNIFGVTAQTAWNPFHLFARDNPEGLDASLLLDIYSRRGPGGGLEGAYEGQDAFGLTGRHFGEFLGYVVHDDSTDILGLDRRKLTPEDETRGRLFWRHRHEFPWELMLNAEVGFVGDRNFLEQYYEDEFDRDKDNESLLYLQQTPSTNWGWSLLARPQTNDFENTTEWGPKGDLYALGEPLLDGWLSWTMHSSAGYGHLIRADAPSDPRDLFMPIPYIADAEGAVLTTRHELAAPFNIGPVVMSPYVRGQLDSWQEDLTGTDLDRAVGTGGVRGSLSMWRVLPYVRDPIFNLNGLAHKMTFDFDYSYTDSTEDFTTIAQYNELDDDAQERFRQRFLTNTFGGVLPAFLEPRRYAIRSGAASLLSVPYHELVDDLHVLRVGWRHRLQTKVGPPDRQRIRDWMTLDLEAAWFPQPENDNFGEDFGLLTARYSWLLSSRTTLLAGATYDTFDGGQQLWHVGLLTQRPGRGSLYVGVREIKAQSLESQILTSSVSYLLNEKWIATASTAYDLAEGMNRGQSLTITRAGADWLFHIGGSYDSSKDSYGVAIALEPRFGRRDASSTQLSSLLGTPR